MVKVNELYEHYKGKRYKILAIARDSEDIEKHVVVYQGLYDSDEFGDNPVWARELNEFLEEVDLNGKKIKRFKLVE